MMHGLTHDILLWSHWGFLSSQATEYGVNNWVRIISPALFHIYVANRTLLCTIFLQRLAWCGSKPNNASDQSGDARNTWWWTRGFFFKKKIDSSLSPFSCPPRWVTFYFYVMASAWHLLSEHLCITTFPPQLLIHHGFLHVDPPPPPQKLYCS